MPPIPQASFANPEDAESAFYEAVQTGDLEALMRVWADDEEVVCVHPNGQRMVGHAAIRESWRHVFSGDRRLQIAVSRSVRWSSMLMSIHSVIEHIAVDNDQGNLTLAATNVYVRGAGGWRILIHHASAIQDGGDAISDASDHPRVLH
jgi:ketosteroid isomerase-like protein